MNVNLLFRKNIYDMDSYVPGIQPKDARVIKLNTNENPYPPPSAVIDGLKQAIGAQLRLYPDPVCDDLRIAIAKTYGFSKDNIIASNGSDEILSMIIRAFVDPGDSVLLMYPTYSLYKVLAIAQSAKIIECALTEDFSIPQTAYSQQAKVCFVPNPNVPAGNYIDKKNLLRLANTCGGILVIDEAYVDFAEDSCLDLLEDNKNIIITRTFSKSFSLAGMRIGFAIADESVIKGLMKIKDSYNLNRLSALAGKIAVENLNEVRSRAQSIKALRDQTAKQLQSLQFEVLPSQTNFLFARPLQATARFIYEKLLSKNILVRFFDQPRVDQYIRVTIGTENEMKIFIETVKQITEQV
ncbi:MAG: histidinol-phosphate transaminase [Candidatus Auribacterota bacterium]|nr:histidinol-phosphate transaminase [Candidatus Auribacterota bacterium]